MKNQILKCLISLFLILIMSLGVIGCNNGASSDNNSANTDITDDNGDNNSFNDDTENDSDELDNGVTDVQGYTFLNIDQLEYVGIHEMNSEETEVDLVKDGKSEYVLVFPNKSTADLTEVKTDFITLFKKATGVTLAIRTSADVVNDWTPDKKYISVGDNDLVEKAGIDRDEFSIESIKTEGVRIITKGNTQFLLGGNVFGVCNALYTFLEIYFNFDYYHRSGIHIDTGVTNIKFKNLDVTEVPDVEHYTGDLNRYVYGKTPHPWDAKALGAETYAEEVAAMDNRLRVYYADNYATFPVYQEFNANSRYTYQHTFTTFVPKNMEFTIPQQDSPASGRVIKTVEEMVPDNGGDQLCLTARGNEEIYEDLVTLVAEKIIFSLTLNPTEKRPQMNRISFTVEDNWDHCTCAECTRQNELYGWSGITVRFANRVGEYVNEWLQRQKSEDAPFHNCYRDKVIVEIFGYHRDKEPPVNTIQNPDGSVTFVPKDPSVMFNEYTDVYLVSSSSLRLGGLYDVKQGSVFYDMAGWKAVTNDKKQSRYWYNSPILERDFAYDSFTTYSPDFWELIAYFGFCDVYSDHYKNDTKEHTGWQTLLNYMNSKLRWNCHLDPTTIIKNYMKGMYYEAADIMFNVFNEQLLYYVDMRARTDEPERGYTPTAEDYPYPVLEGWINQFYAAMDAVELHKEENPDLYDTLITRIQIEMAIEVVKAVKYYGSSTMRPYSLAKLNEYRDLLLDLSVKSPDMQVMDLPLSAYTGV